MTHPYQSEFTQRYVLQGEAKGEAKGEAEALLRVLNSRGLAISEDARERIRSCADIDQLNTWLDRAVQVTSTDELFT